MKTYVTIDLAIYNGKKFDTTEDAVRELEIAGIKADDIEISVYNAEDNSYLESQVLTTTLDGESYVFIMYCIWDKNNSYGDNYYQGKEVYYNSKAEAEEVLNDAPAGEYSIDGVKQSIDTYFETVSSYEIIKEE